MATKSSFFVDSGANVLLQADLQGLVDDAQASADTAVASETAAATSASDAATSATASANSSATAATSASDAAASASAANTSASSAAASATNAATSATAAQAAADSVTPNTSTTVTATGSYSAATPGNYWINRATNGTLTFSLPAAPTDSMIVVVKDTKGDAKTYPITIVDPNGHTIDGAAQAVLDTNYAGATLVWNSTAWSQVA